MEDKVRLKQTGVKIRLISEDGDAFAILGRVCATLHWAGYGRKFIKAFTDEATSGNYNHLLATVTEIMEVE